MSNAPVVLISNAAGTIAASIVKVVRTSNPDNCLRLIGLAPKGDAVPERLFDKVIRAPLIDVPHLDWFAGVLNDESVRLAIPTTDLEAMSWATLGDDRCLTASPKAAHVCYDKWLSYEHCVESGLGFAASLLPSSYNGDYARCVAKPRRGGLSEGILYDPSFIHALPDVDYVVQEWMPPPEYTIAAYVCRDGTMAPPLVMERVLRYGLTVACTPTHEFDVEARNYLEALCKSFSVIGPFNMQCRLMGRSLVPFEFNCRFSGTCGIRDLFGYQDVRLAISEYLHDARFQGFSTTSGLGYRMITDSIMPDSNMLSVCH